MKINWKEKRKMIEAPLKKTDDKDFVISYYLNKFQALFYILMAGFVITALGVAMQSYNMPAALLASFVFIYLIYAYDQCCKYEEYFCPRHKGLFR